MRPATSTRRSTSSPRRCRTRACCSTCSRRRRTSTTPTSPPGCGRCRSRSQGTSRACARAFAAAACRRSARSTSAPSSATPTRAPADGDGYFTAIAKASGRTGALAERARRRGGDGRSRICRPGVVPALGVAPARPREGCRRPRGVLARLAGLPRCDHRPRGDVRVGLEGVPRAWRPSCKAVCERIHPGATPREVSDELDDDPRHQVTGTDALQRWMQQLSDEAVDELGRTHFEIPDPIRTLDCKIAPPGGTVGAYYTGPSDDLSRPGAMWWSVEQGREVVPDLARGHRRLPRRRSRAPPADRHGRPRAGVAQRLPTSARRHERARRGVGAVRRAADARARLSRRRPGPARHARRPAVPRRPRRRRHRHAPRAGDPRRHRLPRGRALDARPRPRVPARRARSATPSTAPTRSTATSGGQARRRATRSASGCGSTGATQRGARHGDDFDFKAFHTTALQFGGMGLDPLAALLATI